MKICRCCLLRTFRCNFPLDHCCSKSSNSTLNGNSPNSISHRTIEAAQVITELIEIAKKMREADAQGDALVFSAAPNDDRTV